MAYNWLCWHHFGVLLLIVYVIGIKINYGSIFKEARIHVLKST